MNPLRLAVAAVVLIAATGCGYGTAQGSTRKMCDVELFAPSAENDKIVGRAVAVCDATPIKHVMNVGVERKTGDGWSPVLAGGVGWTECHDLPIPGTPVMCERLIPCENGTYRSTVTVTGESAGGSFAFSPPVRPEANVKCIAW